MRIKNVVLSFRPTEKNRCHLQTLGLLDLRTGKKRKTAVMDLSDLLNNCLTIVLESEKSPVHDVADAAELREAWKKFAVGIKNGEIATLQAQIVAIAREHRQLEDVQEMNNLLFPQVR